MPHHQQILEEAIANAGGPERFAELYGIVPVAEGGTIFCGVTEEQFAINGRTFQWPKGEKLSWSLVNSRLGSLTADDIKETYLACFAEIAAACDLNVSYAPNHRTANFIFTTRTLDGPSGVLADHQIPTGNVRVDGTQLVGRYDDAENWGLFEGANAGFIDFKRVALHELLHGCGLGHAPTNKADPALIEPSYSQRVRGLMPRDIAELRRRYGPPKDRPGTPAPTPTDPDTGSPSTLKAEIRVEVAGKWFKAAGPLKPE